MSGMLLNDAKHARNSETFFRYICTLETTTVIVKGKVLPEATFLEFTPNPQSDQVTSAKTMIKSPEKVDNYPFPLEMR